ncbi:uncharacterized protein CC84DRAFT_899519 [Paraphaeosphaeria sporulosa]|uniref:Uncharacterized protein n=1 Tax=Paraphaeosphaeria sporulosa TaxID=1460663 RepID=A0A177C7C4_9PLEO|nr:uncharacterized protein CC84DRAFT_899519 [Paraphaeosphaeria sporulosa]OAG02600.1 hypothetical protein CC84DRAFT_899519 [Paraphaeosphaeria sporulosa]
MHIYSLYVGDVKFSTVVLQAMLNWFKDKGSYPVQGAVAIAYGTYEDENAITRCYKVNAVDNLPGLHRLKRFLVDTYMAVAHATWFEDEDWRYYLHEILRDSMVAMLYKHPAKNKWNIDIWKAELEAEELAVQSHLFLRCDQKLRVAHGSPASMNDRDQVYPAYGWMRHWEVRNILCPPC